MSETDRVTLTIEGPDGTDEVTLPAELLEMLKEEGESHADVVGDLAVMSCAQRAHAAVHHGQGEVPPELKSAEATALELFEDRFGMTFGEATGHSH